jgi:hypothetical protein
MTVRLRAPAHDGGEPEELLAAAQRRLDGVSAIALDAVEPPEAGAPPAAPAADADPDGPAELVPAPRRRRPRRVVAPAADPASVQPGAPAGDGGDPEGLLAAAKAAGEAAAAPADSGRLRRKLVARRGAGPISTDTLGGSASGSAVANSGEAEPPRRGWRRFIPRLPGAALSRVSLPRLSLPRLPAPPAIAVPAPVWIGAAAVAFLIVLVLTVSGGEQRPAPLPVSALRVVWRPGPRLPADDIAAWLRRSPVRDQLGDPNAWVLDQLADWLRQQPAVARLVQVRLIHEPADAHGALRRVLEVELALRTPVMPAMLASGERAWVDAEGRVLPGELPAPRVQRPLLRQVEAAGPATVQAAIAAWLRLEDDLPPGLVGDILCDDQLDEHGARGIVLVTRQGARLMWGSPAEERYGWGAEDRAQALIHALRCQGDLAHVDSINVRFPRPMLVLKD